MIGRWFRVAHPEWIGGIEILDVVVLDEDRRHAVVGRGKQEAVVKADFERTGSKRAVPIGAPPSLTKTEMPLADDGRRIARIMEHRGEGWCARGDDRGGIRRGDAGPRLSKRILAGEE